MTYQEGDRILWHPGVKRERVGIKAKYATVKKVMPGGKWLRVVFDGNTTASGVHIDQVEPA